MLPFFLCFLTAFVVALASIPSIITIANRHSLYDEPNERKLHTDRIPLLGGIAIFGAGIFSFTIWAAPYFEPNNLFIIAALIIIFFFGLRDDIAPLAPLKKLSGQIIACAIVILYCDIRLRGLHGLFGIHTLSLSTSIIWTLFAMLFIINAYNFIDGIDGLAAGLGMIASIMFGALFLIDGQHLFAVIAFSLCGALGGFLPYNFYRARIFMGDTGSMVTGFILSILAIQFLESSHDGSSGNLFGYGSAPLIVLSALIIPVVDMMRVFILRIIRFRSPFSADRNHIHHKLIDLGLNPMEACLILYTIGIGFIIVAWFMKPFSPAAVFYLLLISAGMLTQLPHFLLNKKRKQIV